MRFTCIDYTAKSDPHLNVQFRRRWLEPAPPNRNPVAASHRNGVTKTDASPNRADLQDRPAARAEQHAGAVHFWRNRMS